MALKIRLRQQGRKGRLSYRLVVTDVKAPRDGKYIESLGWYDPHKKEDNEDVKLEVERLEHWLNHGAVPSEKAVSLIKRKAPSAYQVYQNRQVKKKTK